MAAMNEAAKTDSQIAARIDLFRYRVPEEFYHLEKDPDCLHNLIDVPEYQDKIATLQAKLVAHMQRTDDPMLKAFEHRADRKIVEQVLVATYGPQKASKKNTKRKREKRKQQKKQPGLKQ